MATRFTNATAAATNAGVLYPHWLSAPPAAGPMMKPRPNAAPIKPSSQQQAATKLKADIAEARAKGEATAAALLDCGLYDPATNTWTATAVTDTTPYGRDAAVGVWAGNELLVFGGNRGSSIKFGNGGHLLQHEAAGRPFDGG